MPNTNRPGSNFVDLGQQGLSNGDDITGFINSFFESGNEVYIPPGTYTGDPQAFMAGGVSNASVWGDPAGVQINRGNEQVRGSLSPNGNVLIENITFRGVKPELQSRWRIDPGGGDTCTLRNVNWPDGTADPSDSQAVYSEGSGGEVRLENCYIGGHGNSLAYFTYANTHLVIDGCTMMNSNGAVRPGSAGLTCRRTQWFSDGHVPEFSEDGGAGQGAFSRFFKFEQNCNVEISDVHFIQTTQCSNPGPFMDDQAGVSGSIRNAYLYNETGADMVSGGGGLSSSNIHTSGGGDTGVPWAVSGSQQPIMNKMVWRPGSPSLPGGDSPDGNGPSEVVTVDGTTELTAAQATTSFDTLVRTVHSGYTGSGFLDLEPPEDAWAEWPIDVAQGGEYNVVIRYSNGDASQRVGRLAIGSMDTDVVFEPTGSWNTWQTTTEALTITGGETTLRIESTGGDVGQIDSVTLVPTDVGGGRPQQAGLDVGALAVIGIGAAAARHVVDNRE